MLRVNLRAHGRRLVAAGLAVLLGTSFLTLVIAASATFGRTLGEYVGGTVGDAAVVVTAPDGQVPVTVAGRVRRVPGATVATHRSTVVLHDIAGRSAPTSLTSMPDPSRLRVSAGRLPTTAGEVLALDSFVRARRLRVGDRVRLAMRTGGPTREVTLVGAGTTDSGAVGDAGLPTLLAAEPTITAVTGSQDVDEVLVAGPVTVEAVRAAAGAGDQGAGAKGLVVRTGAEEKQARIDELSRGTVALTAVLGAFAVVALVVVALVIANSFGIVLAQRARELALLRCVGATRGQVRRGVLGEAVVVGLGGAVLGIGLGLLLGLAGVRLTQGSRLALVPLVVTPLTIVVPLLVGVLVTVLAAVQPVRRATLVAPVEALRPVVAPSARASRRRTVAGLVVAAVGTGVLVAGAAMHEVPLGVAGGLASFAGVLVLAPVLVPALVRTVGAPLRRMAGVPGEVAVDTVRRTPARAAACASALLVGVTLIVMMSVAAGSAQRSVDADLDRHLPIDLSAGATRSLEPAEVERLRGVDGVQEVTPVRLIYAAQVRSGARPVDTRGVSVVDPARTGAVRDAAVLAGLRPGTAVLHESLGVADGAPLTVRAGGRTVTVTAHVTDRAPQQVVLAAPDAAPLPGGRTIAWVRLTDGADVGLATDRLGDALDGVPGALVAGPAVQRQQLQQVADGMLGVVTGLLAVAVVIALVGIGNTMSLSVLERTRELGLLRALGLTRGEVRRTVGFEALVVALVAVVLGLLLGTGYGVAAAHAVLGGQGDIVVEVPVGRLGVVALVALAAGWLASVLPARRAAAVAPSVALATE